MADYTREQLMEILRRADAAGDSAAAGAAAKRLRGLSAAPQVASSATPSPFSAEFDTGAPAEAEVPKDPNAFPRNITPTLDEGIRDVGNVADRAIAGIGTTLTIPIQSIKQLLGMGKGGKITVPDFPGIRQLTQDYNRTVDATSTEVADIQANRALTESPAGMVGNIGGNVMALGVPVGKAMEGGAALASILPKTLGLRRAAQAAVVPAVSATEAGLLAPVIGEETREGNAVKGALLSKTLQLLGSGAGRMLTGAARPTEDAKKLMAQGIQPTVRQGSEGVGGSAIGLAQGVAEAMPLGFGASVRKGGERFEREMLDVAGQRVHPNTPLVGDPVKRGSYMEDLRKEFDAAYASVLSDKVIPVSALLKSTSLTKGAAELVKIDPAKAGGFARELHTIMPRNPGSMSGETWKELQRKVRENIRSYSRTDGYEAEALADAWRRVDEQLIKTRNKSMSKADAARLDQIDAKYGPAEVLKEAVTIDSTSPGRDLVAAVERMTPRQLKLEEKGWLQDITQPAKSMLSSDAARDTLAQRAGFGAAGIGLGGTALFSTTALALAPLVLGLGKAASTREGAKFLMGGHQWQPEMADALRKYIPTAAAVYGGTEAQR